MRVGMSAVSGLCLTYCVSLLMTSYTYRAHYMTSYTELGQYVTRAAFVKNMVKFVVFELCEWTDS